MEKLALLSGLVSMNLGEDVNREDGQKHGVIGGQNPDGINNPWVQAVAVLFQLSPLAQNQVKAFVEKYNKHAAKKATAVFKPSELSSEAAKHLAAEEGTVQALHQAKSIGPYKYWREFTDGHGGAYEAHHLIEQKWFKQFSKELGDHNLSPSVILTNAEHKVWNTALPQKAKELRVKTLDDLWRMYKEAYADHPEWLAAIKVYFGK